MRRSTLSILVLLAAPTVVAMTLAGAPRVAAQAPDAVAHTQWMNDASDAQEDYRFAVSDKNQKAAVEALAKLESLMARTEDYWTVRKSADGVKLTKAARASAAQAGAAANRGDLAAASTAFDAMSTSCNACHELHLERK
ncbi:MAG: hypothetical protein ABL982_19945 [Vicinamibacterales bacterium]